MQTELMSKIINEKKDSALMSSNLALYSNNFGMLAMLSNLTMYLRYDFISGFHFPIKLIFCIFQVGIGKGMIKLCVLMSSNLVLSANLALHLDSQHSSQT